MRNESKENLKKSLAETLAAKYGQMLEIKMGKAEKPWLCRILRKKIARIKTELRHREINND